MKKNTKTFVLHPQANSDNESVFSNHRLLLEKLHNKPKHFGRGVIYYDKAKYAAMLLCQFINKLNPSIQVTVRPANLDKSTI